MKVYQWKLSDGSLRLFRDKQLEDIVGGWDSDTGRLFEIVGKGHQRIEVEVRTGATKADCLAHFKGIKEAKQNG